MTHDVFISHSSKDKSIADAVCASLENVKISCWIAPRDIRPGDKWAASITNAIENSKIMVLIFSSNSNNSDDVLNEILLAKDAKAIIIPFKIENILPEGEMKYYLTRTHWLDAMDPPTEKHIQPLVETINQFIKVSSSISTPDVTARVEAVELEPQGEIERKQREEQEQLCREEERKEIEQQERLNREQEERVIKLKEKQQKKQREKEEKYRQPKEELKELESTPKTYTSSIGMKFYLVPGGEFMMGSGEYDPEKPVHRVKISKPFYLGTYPVMQKQWMSVMGNNPSYFKGDKLPVETVSWNDVQDFITKLNEKEGGNKYRLPTEAEWEYAARAGTTTRFSFGDNESNLGDYAWYDANSGNKTHDVGQKKSNPWGLYDMHGNVWEWVQDSWHSDYNGAPTDGSSWEIVEGSSWVLRGGCCNRYARDCRSAARRGGAPDSRSYALGFRLLRVL